MCVFMLLFSNVSPVSSNALLTDSSMCRRRTAWPSVAFTGKIPATLECDPQSFDSSSILYLLQLVSAGTQGSNHTVSVIVWEVD